MATARTNINGHLPSSVGRRALPPPRPGARQITPASVVRILGESGLRHLGGRVQEEYVAALKDWRRWARIVIEMQDDTVIATLLDAIKLPLLAADFDVTPASESLVDRAAADFLFDNLGAMNRQTWRSHVTDQLECLDFGFAMGEIILEKRKDGKLWLRNIEPRGQETLLRWEWDQDRVITYTQLIQDTGELIHLPIDKCVHTIFGGRKANPQGRALLRSLHRPWRFLRDLENMEGIGIERDVGGMPILKLPPPAGSGILSTGEIDDLKKHLRALRMDEEMFMILPDGVEINAYGGGSKSYNISEVITRKQKEILMRFFAQFLMLGMDTVGTQALVKGSQDFFNLALTAVQQILIESWSQHLIPFLFRFNTRAFSGMSDFPKLTWNTPGKVDIAAIMSAWQTGTGAQILTPTREDEVHIRSIADFPDLPEGEGEGDRGSGGGLGAFPGFQHVGWQAERKWEV